jgi:hypothetical protein
MTAKLSDLNQLPDPKWHKYISFVKSGLRIAAGITLMKGLVVPAGILFVFAEVLGIAEELV